MYNEGCRILLYEFGGWTFNPLDGSTNEEALMDSLTALNLMQRASGIATTTRRYVDAAETHAPEVVNWGSGSPLRRS